MNMVSDDIPMKPGRIHKAIIQVMRSVGSIGKDGENKEQKYRYRSMDHIYAKLMPLMAKHGIYSVPRVISHTRDDTGKTKAGMTMHYSIIEMEYTFYADDGSSIVVSTIGEGANVSDKASSLAQTACHKKALSQLFALAVDAADPDANTPAWAVPYVGRITRDELTELKKRWMAANNGHTGKSKEDIATLFADWAKKVSECEFDPLIEYQWTRELYGMCEAALDSIPEAEGSE